MHAAVGERAPHDAGLAVDPVLVPQPVRRLVDEEDAPAGRQEAAPGRPRTRSNRLGGHVGQEEAEEDDVVVVGRPPWRRRRPPDSSMPRSPTLARLSSSISGEASVTTSSSACSARRPVHWPVPAASSRTRPRGSKAAQRVADRDRRASANGSPSGRGGGVVLRRAGAVVGDLLVEQLAVGRTSATLRGHPERDGRRDGGGGQRQGLARRERRVAGEELGRRARDGGEDDAAPASSPARARSAPWRRAAAACGSRPRSGRRGRPTAAGSGSAAGWSLAPEASTRLTTPW